MLLLCDSGRCNRFAAAEPELREGGCEAAAPELCR